MCKHGFAWRKSTRQQQFTRSNGVFSQGIFSLTKSLQRRDFSSKPVFRNKQSFGGYLKRKKQSASDNPSFRWTGGGNSRLERKRNKRTKGDDIDHSKFKGTAANNE